MTAQALNQNHSPAGEQPQLSPAESYEVFAVPALFAPAGERLLATARPVPGERVLDVGTGTGIVARLAAPRVGAMGAVTALDVNDEMLRVARAAAAREGLSIAWHQGMAESLPFPEASFDLAVCQFALMFFNDQATALGEMRRVLTSGGRIALNVFQEIGQHPFYVALDQAIDRRLGVSVVSAIFALGDADALGKLLLQAGFGDIAIEPWSMTAHMGPPEAFLAGEIELDTAALPSMQGLSRAARQELISEIAAEMAEPLRAVTTGGEVVIDFHIVIAKARRS